MLAPLIIGLTIWVVSMCSGDCSHKFVVVHVFKVKRQKTKHLHWYCRVAMIAWTKLFDTIFRG